MKARKKTGQRAFIEKMVAEIIYEARCRIEETAAGLHQKADLYNGGWNSCPHCAGISRLFADKPSFQHRLELLAKEFLLKNPYVDVLR